ncbi:MAG: hypothetical protein ABSB77_04410, partial [Xanthobacteraceae bacterium]
MTWQLAPRRRLGGEFVLWPRELRFSQRVWRIMLNGRLRGSVAFQSGWGSKVGSFDYIAPAVICRSCRVHVRTTPDSQVKGTGNDYSSLQQYFDCG